ncbi:MAG: OmpH family outer membrane protein [Bacteroidetes bacterium]|nr:OmpH family outer membrane protein [Bacteroidota bacterium]
MNSKNIQIISFVLIATLACWIAYNQLNTPKVGFIVIQEVYNGFEFKKEMEKKFISTKNLRQKLLDSLAFDLKLLGKKIEAQNQKNSDLISEYNLKREDFFQKKKVFEEDNQNLTSQYDEQILSQLNQYVKDFGKEKNYTYILGNDGNGSLMFGSENKNISKEVLEYINSKYKGIK